MADNTKRISNDIKRPNVIVINVAPIVCPRVPHELYFCDEFWNFHVPFTLTVHEDSSKVRRLDKPRENEAPLFITALDFKGEFVADFTWDEETELEGNLSMDQGTLYFLCVSSEVPTLPLNNLTDYILQPMDPFFGLAPASVCSRAFDLLLNEPDKFADVEIWAKGEDGKKVAIPAVKYLLATSSDYFKSYFETGSAADTMRGNATNRRRESEMFQIDESDTDVEVVRDVLTFVMTGGVCFQEDANWLVERYMYASRVGVEGFKSKAISWMMKQSPTIACDFFFCLRMAESTLWSLVSETFVPFLQSNSGLIREDVYVQMYDKMTELALGGETLFETELKFAFDMSRSYTDLQTWVIFKRQDPLSENFLTTSERLKLENISRKLFCRLIVLLDEEERNELTELLGFSKE